MNHRTTVFAGPIIAGRRGLRFAPSSALMIVLSLMLGLPFFSASSVWAGEYSVQIGAFRKAPGGYAVEAEKVGELFESETAEGITRLQIGRFDSKESARAALAALKGAGYADAFVVQKGVRTAVATRTKARPSPSTRSNTPARSDASLQSLPGNLPDSIRSRVVLLDGAYHVKEGDEFTPLQTYLSREGL